VMTGRDLAGHRRRVVRPAVPVRARG
jgi:hypothetical protein